jgi:hypothetical protein
MEINYNGSLYDYTTQCCIDSYEIAVNLDLGNGHPETIGYLPADATKSEVREMVREELERWQSS